MSKYRKQTNFKKDQKFFSKSSDRQHPLNKTNTFTNPMRGGIRL